MLHERCLAKNALSAASLIDTHVRCNASSIQKGAGLHLTEWLFNFNHQNIQLDFLIELRLLCHFTAAGHKLTQMVGSSLSCNSHSPSHCSASASLWMARKCRPLQAVQSGLSFCSSCSSQPEGACLTCYSFWHFPTPLPRQWSQDSAGSLHTATSGSHQFQG